MILCGLAGFFEEYVPVFLRNINLYRVNLTIGVSETIRGRSENLKVKGVRELYYGNENMSLRTIMIFPKFDNIDIIDEIREKYDPLAKLV